jgi:AraC-like DNA-binding protein
MVSCVFERLNASVTLIANAPEDFFQAHKMRHPGAYNFEPRANRRNDWTASAHVMNMGDARIVAASFSGYSVSNAGDAFCRIFIPLKKPMALQSGSVKRTVSPSMAVLAPIDGFRSSYMDDSAGLFFNAKRASLAEALETVGSELELEALWGERAQNPLPRLGDFRVQWLHSMRALGAGPVLKSAQYLATHQELLLLRLAYCLAGPAPSLRSAPAHARNLTRAIEYVRAHSANDLRLAEVAKAAGCGVRTLQVLFQAEMMCSITGYIALTRLQAAHRRLTKPEPGDNVTSIAMDCGFSHLGEFSQSYFRTYAERPSETLARARGGRGSRQ